MGQSALICACARGHTAIARTLLEAGADVHAKDEVSFLQFCREWCCLLAAAVPNISISRHVDAVSEVCCTFLNVVCCV
jgi:hypothetical protein